MSILFLSPLAASAQFSGGDGTQENPYIITTATELANLAILVNNDDHNYNGKIYKLGNDIDLSVLGENFNDGKGWVPIGIDENSPFWGQFYGNNYEIKNLYINSKDLQYVGLFGSIVGGRVENLGVVDIKINVDITSSGSYEFVGGIVGKSENGLIISCYTTGLISINAPSSYVGGVVGVNTNMNFISKCYSTCNVNSISNDETWAGGVVGCNYTVISDCYSTGNISAYSEFEAGAGGIAGFNENIINNCYSISLISSSSAIDSYAGGIAAKHNSGSISYCAALNPRINCTGQEYKEFFGRIVGYAYDSIDDNIAFKDMLNPEGNTYWQYIAWHLKDGDNITKNKINEDGSLKNKFTITNGWTIEDGKLPGLFGKAVEMPDYLFFVDFSGGVGSEGSPYIITTAEQLARLAKAVNIGCEDYTDKHYILGNNIDLSGYNNDEGWIPIGSNYYFGGVFDGNNKVISNLYINNITNTHSGLFGRNINTCIIKNLGLEKVNITSNNSVFSSNYVGGIIGYNTGSILSCYTTGSVSSSSVSNSNIGGITGENTGNVENCYSTCSVSAVATSDESNSAAGGVVGLNDNDGSVITCYSTGFVSSNSKTATSGGVVGINRGVSVTNCVALNPNISCIGGVKNYGRVVGNDSANPLSNNIAFSNMLYNNVITTWENIGQNKKNGQNITKVEINSDGSLGNRFTEAVWTTENRKLPGLFGFKVEMPEFLKVCYLTIESNPTGAGTVSGEGYFEADSTVTIKAEANEGYKFLNWRIKNNQVVSSNQSYTFKIDKDTTLIAYFELLKYTVSLSVNIESGGTVSGAGDYNYDTNLTVKANPNTVSNYVFMYWINTDNGNVILTSEYTFKVKENINLMAYFKKNDRFLLSVVVVPADAGTIEGAGEYAQNDEVTVKAIPNTGYIFINWTKGGVLVSENEIYSFTISEDIILIANFKSIGDGEATLSNIEISGGRLSPPLSPDIFSYRLLFDCKQNNISVEFTPLGSASVKIDDLELENGIKNFEMKNAGTIPITVSVINGVYISDYTFELVRPFDNAITPLWNDVLSVINNPAINGGYNFTEFQWYSDLLLLEPILNATNGYITVEDNKNANYNVWLKGNKEGAEFSSFGCRYEVADKSVTLRVYPNPTSDKITVEVENSPPDFIMELNDIQGITVMKKIITQPVFEINMKEFPKGIYILMVEGKTVRIVNYEL